MPCIFDFSLSPHHEVANLGFEPDLKLTEEMLEVMDGKKSVAYNLQNLIVSGLFVHLVGRGHGARVESVCTYIQHCMGCPFSL